MGRGVFRNYYKGHMDKNKGEGEVGKGGGSALVGWRNGEKWHRTVIE